MKLELDEHEQATLIGLLVEAIETSKLPSSPRLKSAKSILAKLGINYERYWTRSPEAGWRAERGSGEEAARVSPETEVTQ
jgi:hypothetical protein